MYVTRNFLRREMLVYFPKKWGYCTLKDGGGNCYTVMDIFYEKTCAPDKKNHHSSALWW